MTGPENDMRAVARAALRRATLTLVLGVCALDGVALALFYGAGIAHTAPRVRTIFTLAWTIATALTVTVLLRRVRSARRLVLSA